MISTASGLRFIVLLIACLLAGGCATTAVLTEAALYSCGTNTVYLGGWWASVPVSSTIDIDPMGGFQLAYWVDDAGNACHGNPGQSGQLGPAAFNAYRMQAHDLAANQSSVTAQQLKTFQEIPISLANYSGSGWHFVQFDNTIWRNRVDGKSFQANSDGTVSIPIVTDIGSKACVAPVAFQLAQRMFLPGSPTTASQDPSHCRVRSFPASASMTEEERKKYDILKLPHGTEIFTVP